MWGLVVTSHFEMLLHGLLALGPHTRDIRTLTRESLYWLGISHPMGVNFLT
jgi:hypothetical protein